MRDVVEVALRVGGVEVDRRREEAVVQRNEGCREAGGSRGALRVAQLAPSLGLAGAPEAQVFARLRAMKDAF